MEKVYKKARAKVNLTLNILDKREDGYHNLETVFQKISLYDELYVEKQTENKGIVISSNVKELENKDNIICRAYDLLRSNFLQITGVKVLLKKNIPMQARFGRR